MNFTSKKITIDKFLKLDISKQKELYLLGMVNSESVIERLENDEKIAYYSKIKRVGISSRGSFYKKVDLEDYIVYNKKNKKVSIKGKRLSFDNNLVLEFLNDYFDKNGIFLMKFFISYITKEFAKKIFQNKIHTIEDICNYHKSYTLRDKSIDLKHIYDCIVSLQGSSYLQILNCIDDKENIEHYKFDKVSIPYDYVAVKPFKITCDQVNYIYNLYDDYIKNLRSRNGCEGEDVPF